MMWDKECSAARKYQCKAATLMLATLLGNGGAAFAQSGPDAMPAQNQAQTSQSPSGAQGTLPVAPDASHSSSRANASVVAADASPQNVTPQVSATQAPVQASDARVQGTKVDPAAGPQTPTAAPTVQEQQDALTQQQAVNDQAQAAKQTRSAADQQPLGTAAAERGTTQGGVAARPAGVAIAPAKQHQMRSILIKTGALLAGAAAIGTVYGLTKATPSNPPGAKTSTTTAATAALTTKR